MPFIAPNPSQAIGEMSPYYMSVLHNSGGVLLQSNVTGYTPLGLVRVAPVRHKMSVRVTANKAYASGESCVLSIRYLTKEGEFYLVGAFVTLDDTTITGPGTIERSIDVITPIEAGESYELQRVYIPGGTPANPVISVSVQIL